MAIQNLPVFYNMPYTTKEGNLSSGAQVYHDQTYQALNAQMALSNGTTSTVVQNGSVTINGINPPSKTTAEIAALFADASIPVGTIWYDSNLGKLKFKGATLQLITSTP